MAKFKLNRNRVSDGRTLFTDSDTRLGAHRGVDSDSPLQANIRYIPAERAARERQQRAELKRELMAEGITNRERFQRPNISHSGRMGALREYPSHLKFWGAQIKEMRKPDTQAID